MKDKLIAAIITFIIAAAIIFICVFLTKAIWESDLPMWLKIILLR